MRWGARTVNILRSTIAGESPNVSGVVRSGNPLTKLSRYRTRLLGSPFALIYDGLSPFVNKIYRPPGGRLRRAERELFLARRRGLRSLYVMKVPLTISNVPPDETLLTFTRFSGLAKRRALERRALLVMRAGRNFGFAGAPIIGLPASTTLSDSCRILSDIQRMLLEPIIDSGVTWSLWTQQEVFDYMTDRINKFLLETGITRTRVAIPLALGQRFVSTPEDCLVIKRVVLQSTTYSPLTRVDPFMLDNAYPGWETAGSGTIDTVYGYIENPQNGGVIEIARPLNAASTLHIEYVPKQIMTLGVCEPIMIPETLVPFIKYGILADMLGKQGEANDSLRATYCEQRFGDGVELAGALMGQGGRNAS
jgi:hypothetical protein